MDNNFQIDSAAISDRGLSEKRPQNEDSYLEINDKGIFAVADGVGGAQAGDVASQMAMEILGEAFENMQTGSDPEDVMKLAIDRANSAIYQMSRDLPQLSTMATTIVALHVSGNIATIGHVGDSRLYRLDHEGELYRETQDHSVVEEEVRAGRMTPEQAAYHPSRNVISRALGAESSVEIDMKTIMFEPGTSFLICSDGITRHIQDFEIKELLNSGMSSAEICRQMKEICYERGAEDNLTAVIVRISGQAAVQSPYSENFASTNAAAAEESTIATARSAHSSNGSGADSVESGAAGSDDFAASEEQTVEYAGGTQISIPADEGETSAVTQKHSAAAEPAKTSVPFDEPEENKSGGFLAKAFAALILLIAGAVLGVAGYYYLMPKPEPAEIVQPQPPIVETPENNIEYQAFEDNRRNVDKNPSQFIRAIQNSAQDAEDYYLLGRAYLLSGKFPEAKSAFTEAKNRLAMSGEVNSRILASEIAMGMALVNTPNAAQEFLRQLPPRQPASPSTNANVNSR